jgi:hypothetical protein
MWWCGGGGGGGGGGAFLPPSGNPSISEEIMTKPPFNSS